MPRTLTRPELVAFLRKLGIDTNEANRAHMRLKFAWDTIDVKVDSFVRDEKGLVQRQPSGEGLLRRHDHFVVNIVEEAGDALPQQGTASLHAHPPSEDREEVGPQVRYEDQAGEERE